MTRFGSFAFSARLAAAASVPGPAVVDGGLRWSWHDLDEHADAVARGLVGAGARPGDRVVLLGPSSAAAVAMLHGAARRGVVVAPVGPGRTESELAAAVAAIDPRLVVVAAGAESGSAPAGIGRPVIALDDLIRSGRARGTPAVTDEPPRDPVAPVVVILTSGTTGRPRPAILSTAALTASAAAWLAALQPATGWLLALGLGHVAGLGVAWRAALSGVPLVVADPDPLAIAAALADDPAPSHVSLVPTMLARLLDAVHDGPPPATLRAVLLGGGPIPAELVRRALVAGWPIVPTYGLTEAGSGVTALPLGEAALHPESAGRALPGVELRIADPDDSGVGEIVVHTPARFSGYRDDPVATAAAFIDGDWLRTGDLGRLDPHGRLLVLDRRLDRIVRGGENLSPAEVEAALLAHPAIAAAAVVARRDPGFGQVPVAAIVLRPGVPDPGDEALALHCRSRLSGFKVPVAFTRLEALPMTASGKLRRAELRARLDADADDARPAAAEPSVPAGLRHLARPGGVRLASRSLGNGPVHLVLLHGTLSTGAQLSGLVRLLAAPGDLTVHALDRRGSGESRLADPTPLAIEVHLDDLAALLDSQGVRTAALVGVSFGGVVALEFAAARPERTLSVVAFEPPYGPLADAKTRRAFGAVGALTERAFRAGGAPRAAETFLRGVAGGRAWDRLPERSKAFLAEEGASAYVDAGLRGLDPSRLAQIRVPVTIMTGDASGPIYGPIAAALVERVPGARRVQLPGMSHASPITDPGPIAAAVRMALAADGVIDAGPTSNESGESHR